MRIHPQSRFEGLPIKRFAALFCFLLLACLPALADTEQEDEDAEIIKACTDPILVISILGPDEEEGVQRIVVQQSLRGKKTPGKVLRAKWDTPETRKSAKWIVMLHFGEDGVYHVHDKIRYSLDADEDRMQWLQKIVGTEG